MIYRFAMMLTLTLNVLSADQVKVLNDLDQIIQDTITTHNLPGVAVGIVLDNQVICTKGYGLRDVQNQLPVTEKTLFPIASSTKAFTAYLIGQLVQEGKLSYDDLVIKHLPEFSLLDKQLAEQITIRDLLAHRTGIQRHDFLWVLGDFTRHDILKLLSFTEAQSPFRQGFEYNNCMYTVAGLIIEKVTQQTWEEAIVSRVLRPIGMDSSNVTLAELLASNDYALPYAEIDDHLVNIPYRNLFPTAPGGAINANITDLMQWALVQINDPNLQEQHTAQMKINENINYGLGWFIENYRDTLCINHKGCIDGFSSEVAFLPNEKIGIAILVNSSTDGYNAMDSICKQILDRCLDLEELPWAKDYQDKRSKEKDAIQKALIAPEAITLPLNPYVGSYTHPGFGTVDVTLEDGKLIAKYLSNTTTLTPIAQDQFNGTYKILLYYRFNPIIPYNFNRDAAGNILSLDVSFEAFRGAKAITFTKCLEF